MTADSFNPLTEEKAKARAWEILHHYVRAHAESHAEANDVVAALSVVASPSSQPASEPDELLCSLLSAYGRLMFDRGATGAALERPRAYYDVLNRVRELLAPVPALPDSEPITVEEAYAVIEGIHYLPDPRYEVWLSGINKLRHIAGMAPRPRPHAVPPHMPGKSNV